ncbi:MAG: sugar ABC transporter permease, partial [Oscillospiraceae bacterium]|nr:sugar ABC transporter permease [Oscillospiraceae bacterium]
MAAKAVTLNRRSRKLMMRETVTSYLFLAPFLLFFVMFVLYPMFMCVYTSFFDATMGREDIFIGFENYKTLFNDEVFWIALRNTLVIVVVSVPVTCAFSLWVASAISKMPMVATSLFRCIVYLPVVTGSVAVTMVWKWMYNNYYGIFNYLGNNMGLIEK